MRRHALVVECLVCTFLVRGQSPVVPPEFEVASIKPNLRGGSLVHLQPSPGGRLLAENFSLRMLMSRAYGVELFQISGGPVWIDTDRYDVQAKAAGNPTEKQITGPMLERLLENRFHLKVHREIRQLPVYELTVAKGGPKIHPSKNGICTPFTMNSVLPGLGEPRPTFCGFRGFGVEGTNRTLDALGITIAELTAGLSKGDLRRTVIDKTGLAGIYDVHMKFVIDAQGRLPLSASDVSAPPVETFETNGPSIFTAMQEQLGLRLDSTRGPVAMIVIDRVEKPSQN
jgi:uncharacterized protein (TIGR03435 family)